MMELAAGLRAIAAQDCATAVLEHTLAVALRLTGLAGGRTVALTEQTLDVPPAVLEQARQVRGVLRTETGACLALGSPASLLALVLLDGRADPDCDVLLDILSTAASGALLNVILREELQRDGERQRASDAELAFERNLLRTLVDHLPFRIYAKDCDSRFLFGNNRMARLAGVAEPADLYGKTDHDFFPAELAEKYFEDEQHVLESGQSLLDYEELVEDQDTGELGWTVTTKMLLRDEQGAVNGIVGIGYDITLRKQMEARLRERSQALEVANATLKTEKEQQEVLIRRLSDIQGQLLQSEKMASIGLLAAGVAHEINNPLAFVNANFGALERAARDVLRLVDGYQHAEALLPDSARAPLVQIKREIGLDDIRLDLDDLLGESLDGLKRVKHIVDNLKDFSRASGTSCEPSNLEQGLESTLNVAWNEIKYKAQVVREYAGVPEVSCLPSQINQVFLNLLINAAQAIESEGTITVRTGYDEAWVWVEIADSGAGIAPEHRDRIFEPFFTTKPIGKGTGLGLSIVYGIVQGHQGSIDVRSVQGKGTTFKVSLPRSA